jgi:hypothetical protein
MITYEKKRKGHWPKEILMGRWTRPMGIILELEDDVHLILTTGKYNSLKALRT